MERQRLRDLAPREGKNRFLSLYRALGMTTKRTSKTETLIYPGSVTTKSPPKRYAPRHWPTYGLSALFGDVGPPTSQSSRILEHFEKSQFRRRLTVSQWNGLHKNAILCA